MTRFFQPTKEIAERLTDLLVADPHWAARALEKAKVLPYTNTLFGERSWLSRLHLATNNLPGIEQLIKTGRRVPWDRYSRLAIDDCYLLPGIPVPVFAAVAGDETNAAIKELRGKFSQLLFRRTQEAAPPSRLTIT